MSFFDVDEFNEMIAEAGQRCEWMRSFACPCVNPASGAADKTCAFCQGFGHLWEDPVEAVVAKTGSNVTKRWAQFGMYEEGDAVFTIGSDSPAYAIGAFDRVRMLDQTEPFSFNVVPGVTRPMSQIVSVEKVLQKVDGQLVSLGLPDVDQLGNLSWADGEPQGTYSLSGRRLVEYFAWTSQPLDRPYENGEALPRRIVMKRFDLYSRQG